MNRWNEEALRAALAALSLAAAGCGEAHAGPPKDKGKDYDRAAASASASVSALPPEPEVPLVDGHKAWAPAFDVAVPETASEAPAKEDWAAAPLAGEVRITDSSCRAQRLREWYRLTCKFGQRVELISGRREDVSFGCFMTRREDSFCDEVWVIFPARRGDRRAFDFLRWGKWAPEPDAIVTEQFLPGDPGPIISLQGIRWGF
jgi:hypothetical protein